MPTWLNNDSPASKPKFNYERQVMEFAQLVTSANTASGANVLFFGTTQNVSNAAIANGMYVTSISAASNAFAIGGNGYPGFFFSNTTVVNVTANTVTLSTNALAVLPANAIIEFDSKIPLKANIQANTYNQDTVFVTPTRLANALVNVDHTMVGWVHVQKKTNNDGTVRYLTEVLTVMGGPTLTASNVSSGNTSTTAVYSGV